MRAERVTLLADIRERPQSRKPGFSRVQLSRALVEAGIDYLHLPSLGTPTDVRRAYQASHDWQPFAEAYAEHLAEQSGALDELAALIRQGRVCLLCFEADPASCHRSITAERLQARTGAAAIHL